MRTTPEEYAEWQREAGLVKVMAYDDRDPFDTLREDPFDDDTEPAYSYVCPCPRCGSVHPT